MKWKAVALALGLFLALAGAIQARGGIIGDPTWWDPALRTRVEPALLKQLMQAGPNDRVPLIVIMRDQAPGSQAQSPQLDRLALVTSLQAVAAETQQGVRQFLAAEQAAGRAQNVQSFWIFNGLALSAAPETARQLALRVDVELLRLDRYEKYVDADPAAGREAPPASRTAAGSSPQGAASPAPTAPNDLAWGVQRVRADQVWSALHITAAGVVVANMDTGVDFLHPALNANYRGNGGKGLYQHLGNWYDATSDHAVYPHDGVGHGTHTMGTLAGQGGIGVAPDARWIAVRIFDSQGYAYDSWIHAGFQWILAPGGDPALAPQVLSNSWGADNGFSTEFQADVEQLQQAGIFVVFSAGNNGPQPETLGSPASLPGVLAAGATDVDDEAASFSSRGPAPSGEIKPQISAPGVNVTSAWPGGSYQEMSGTSMAAPHVAGVAALMLSAHPGLSITATTYALTSTAVTHAATRPNNDTGWGRVDAYAAVQAVAGAGELSGQVRDAVSRLALPDVQVTVSNLLSGAVSQVSTGADGGYQVGLAAAPYRVTARRFGYESETVPRLIIVTGTEVTQNFALEPLPMGVLRGAITDTVTLGPASAVVSAVGTPVAQAATGRYELDLPAGNYTIQVRGLGYRIITATVSVSAGHVTEQNFGLVPAPRILFVNSGAWYYQEYPGYFRQALDSLDYAYDEWRIKHPPSDTPGADDLKKYDLVLWSAPQDSPGLVGASQAITRFLKAGGSLILTGQDVAFWDGGGVLTSYSPYLHDYLKTNLAADNSGSHSITGQSGDILEGLALDIAGGDGADNQRYPDAIAISDPDYAAGVLRYTGGDGGVAGNKVGLCLKYRALVLSFGFEAVNTAADRKELLRRAIDYLAGPRQQQGLTLSLASPQVQVAPPGGTVTFTLRVRNTGELGGAVAYRAKLANAAWNATITPQQFTLLPCAAGTVTVTARIPAGAPVDARNQLTVTTEAVGIPQLTRTVTLTAKSPAPVLLVDHHRWYDVSGSYTQALSDAGTAYDLWTVPQNLVPGAPPSVSLDRLRWYPVVVWFTGYDWYRPLSAAEERELSDYVKEGGRLLLSSAFYLDQRGDSDFARQQLGILAFTAGMTSTQVFGSPGHPLAAGFDRVSLVDPFPRAGFFTLDTAIEAAPSAAAAWRGDYGLATAVARTNEGGGKSVFWSMPLEALPRPALTAVLKRSVGWLGSLGGSSVQVDPPNVSAGSPVTLTFVLRNDRVATAASLHAQPPPGFEPDPASLPPGLSYDPASRTLAFSGGIGAGQALAFTVPLLPSGAQAGRRSGSVTFRDETQWLDFDQPIVVAVDAPALELSIESAAPASVKAPAAITVTLRNPGAVPTSGASMQIPAPVGTRVVTGTASLLGPGSIQERPEGLTWRGDLISGSSITVTCQLRAADLPWPLLLPVEAVAWDGAGGAWERRVWLSVPSTRLYFPFIPK